MGQRQTKLKENILDEIKDNFAEDIIPFGATSDQSYQFNATGPLKDILPEYYEDWVFYGRTHQDSYFNWKSLQISQFNKDEVNSNMTNIEQFVTSFWKQTYQISNSLLSDNCKFDPNVTILI